MKKINPDNINVIISALDEGVTTAELVKQFPDAQSVIEEIEETRRFLKQAKETIPVPVTTNAFARLHTTEGPVPSPYINKLILSMNYRIVVPVLVLGLVAVGGAVLMSGSKSNQIAQTTNTTETPLTNEENAEPMTNNEVAANSAIEVEPAPIKATNNPKPIVADNNIDNILANFTAAALNEQQVALAADRVTEDMFAQAELSGFETDTYDF